MTTLPITALFGGTFDPIHYGHLKPVMALADEIGLSRVYLLPNYIPPHRPQPLATPAQRMMMLTLAIADLPLFAIDQRELLRSSPSYTIDTLIEWRQQQSKTASLAFIMGQDSLVSLPSWHRWQELLDHCHLIVCPRPGCEGTPLAADLLCWINQHLTHDHAQLARQPFGCLYMAKTPLEAISSTHIRQQLAAGQACQTILPDAVLAYIHAEHLYGT